MLRGARRLTHADSRMKDFLLTLLLRSANQRSMRLSHDALVGVKWS